MRQIKNLSHTAALVARAGTLRAQDGLPIEERAYNYDDQEYDDVALKAVVAMAANLNPLDAAWHTHVIGCPVPKDPGIGGIALSSTLYP